MQKPNRVQYSIEILICTWSLASEFLLLIITYGKYVVSLSDPVFSGILLF